MQCAIALRRPGSLGEVAALATVRQAEIQGFASRPCDRFAFVESGSRLLFSIIAGALKLDTESNTGMF
jgi:hypothetical protein